MFAKPLLSPVAIRLWRGRCAGWDAEQSGTTSCCYVGCEDLWLGLPGTGSLGDLWSPAFGASRGWVCCMVSTAGVDAEHPPSMGSAQGRCLLPAWEGIVALGGLISFHVPPASRHG